MSVPNFFALSAKDKKQQTISMKEFEGKVVLVVNVASKCGFTKQYAGLEELYKKYKDQGFVIIGFPCNQFGGQVKRFFTTAQSKGFYFVERKAERKEKLTASMMLFLSPASL